MSTWQGPTPANAYGDDCGGEAGVATFARYSAPSSGFGVFWYSFDVGSIHYVHFSSEHDYSAGSAQQAWLRADLAAVDRARTPWVFASIHAPFYNTNAVHQGDGEAARAALEPILAAARVDAVFAGHVHAYERFHRVVGGARDARGPVYVTVGDGGNREGLQRDWLPDAAGLSAFRAAAFGHGLLTIQNATHARWEWHDNAGEVARVGDSVDIVKGGDA